MTAVAVGSGLLVPAQAQSAVDATPPTVSIATPSGVRVSAPLTIESTEPLPAVTTGPDSPSFTLQPASGGPAVLGEVTTASDQSWRFRPDLPLVTGETYRLVLGPGITDAAGNPAVVGGSPVRTTTKADNTSPGWSSTGRWSLHRSSAAKGRSYVAARRGATARIEVVGAAASLYGCKAPHYGVETVSVDGTVVATVPLSHHYTACGVRLWHAPLSPGQHTVRITVTKRTGDLDEVAVS